MMDWQRLIDLGAMTPGSVDTARSNALTNALFQAGAAFSKAGAPSRTPGGQPLNLAPVFTNYQNALANSMKQGLMMKQLERQEEEYKRKEAQREALTAALTPMPVTRHMPTGQHQMVTDLGYEPKQGAALSLGSRYAGDYGVDTRTDYEPKQGMPHYSGQNLPRSGAGSGWMKPGFGAFNPSQTVRVAETRPVIEEMNPVLKSVPASLRPIMMALGKGGAGKETMGAMLAAGLKDTRPSSVKEIAYLQRHISSLPVGSPNRVALEQRLKKITTPSAPLVQIGDKQSLDISKRIMDNWFEDRKSAGIAHRIVGNMNRLDQLLDQGVKTGWAADKMLSVNRALKAMGLTDTDVSGEEEFIAIITRAAISGAKELGVNPTDKDLEMIFARGAELHKTIKGNRMIIKAYRENARRTIARSSWVDNFVENNEELLRTNPLSFEITLRRELRKFSEKLYQDSKIATTTGSGESTATPGMWKNE